MKGLIFLVVVVLAGYAGWQMTPEAERKKALRFVVHHGIRLGGLLLVVLLLAGAAYYLSVFSLTF